MIDIIIPAYNAHKTIEKTLFSIAFQENVDELEVCIVNDCSKKDYSDIVNYFKNFMKIKELKLSENRGPGYARQYGIDNTKNPYIVFIDADDVFFSFNSIKILYDKIVEEECDWICSGFIEETDDERIEIDSSISWVHGKIYRRKFLIDNDIRFSYTYSHEDVYFNHLFLLHNPKEIAIEDITYIWCNNQDSITRKNNYEYNITGLNGFMDNITLALEKAIEQNCDYNLIAERAQYDIVAMYCNYMKYFNDYDINIILKKSKRLKEISEIYEIQDINEKNNIIIDQIKSSDNFDDFILNPFITFSEFLQLVDDIKE